MDAISLSLTSESWKIRDFLALSFILPKSHLLHSVSKVHHLACFPLHSFKMLFLIYTQYLDGMEEQEVSKFMPVFQHRIKPQTPRITEDSCSATC